MRKWTPNKSLARRRRRRIDRLVALMRYRHERRCEILLEILLADIERAFGKGEPSA